MGWPEQQFTKSAIDKAGKFIAKNAITDINTQNFDSFIKSRQIVNNWRTAHGAVINTAQAWVRRLPGANQSVFGQRLKRYDTITDKLRTGRCKSLATMQDIAGVRVIFPTLSEVYSFRDAMQSSQAKHKRVSQLDKYDYVLAPKETGYRGIHDVYERHVNKDEARPWNGLKFETQLRTAVQHYWATAVEIFDSTFIERFKFNPSSSDEYMQFLVISEIFARFYEDKNGCLKDMNDTNLIERYRELEETTGLVNTLRGLRVANEFGALQKNSILQITNNNEINIRSFRSMPEALRAIEAIEQQNDTLNAVLVGAQLPHHIRSAFRNYFGDARDFIKYVDDAVKAFK